MEEVFLYQNLFWLANQRPLLAKDSPLLQTFLVGLSVAVFFYL